mmetsp:Transcript_30035/g.80157  ORF Transcript_30035/g.80157 Transcript_30035/m.80157 type:complete len:94 (-) Transcript_30035:592-873(-)
MKSTLAFLHPDTNDVQEWHTKCVGPTCWTERLICATADVTFHLFPPVAMKTTTVVIDLKGASPCLQISSPDERDIYRGGGRAPSSHPASLPSS